MRCPDCNKFVSYDCETEPEIDNEEVSEDGVVSATARVVLTCIECGTELKEGVMDLEEQADVAHDHPEGDDIDLTVETDGAEAAEGKRGAYDVRVAATVRCACGFEAKPIEMTGLIRSSDMDECC